MQCQYNPIATMQAGDELRDGNCRPMYRAAGATLMEEASDNWRELILRGKRVTKIVKVLPGSVNWDQPGGKLPKECAIWLEELKRCGIDLDSAYPWHHESCLAAVSRTIIADQDKYESWVDQRANRTFGLTLDTACQHPDRGDVDLTTMFADLAEKETEGENNILRYLNTTKRVCARRVFFLGQNGCFGLAPADARDGDEICVLFGGEVPYVIREVDNGFEFVGESYCHGFMDGEAVCAKSSVDMFRLL